MKEARVLFVAGDGASGRILCEAEQRLRNEVSTRVVVQQGGGAEGLCKGESRPHTVVSKEEPGKVTDLLRDATVAVVAHSGTAYQVEVAACKAAFARRTPCIKVFDHPLGTHHPYLRDVVNFWIDADRPPFLITAITEGHAKMLLELYPELTGLVRTIGNPLHIKLETLFAEGRDAVRTRLRVQYGLPLDKPVAAIFLSGTSPEQFMETLSQSGGAVDAFAARGGGVAVDVHYTNKDSLPAAEEQFAVWRTKATVAQGISQDEMVALCDVLIAAPGSTTCERALSYGIPVIQFGGPVTTAALQQFTGKSFPNYSPELEHGAVLWASAIDWGSLLESALDPMKQSRRNDAARTCGTVPQPGAMQRLLNQIRDLLSRAS